MIRPSALLAAAAVLVALSGCSEDVPSAGGLTESYTIWGALDPTADVQRLRVVRITPTITTGDPSPLPAVVTSTDVATGVVTTWRDSVVTFADGTVGHVAVGLFRPTFESVHVVRVTDPDRPEVSAVVRVPARVARPVRLPNQTNVDGPVYLGFWPDAPRLNRVRVRYTFFNQACGSTTIERNARPADSQPVEFGWQVRVPIGSEAPGFASTLGAGRHALVRIAISGEVASEDWRPPGGIFDPEVIVEPTAFGNVTGGFGFVGAAYETTLEWEPTVEDLRGSPYDYRYAGC